MVFCFPLFFFLTLCISLKTTFFISITCHCLISQLLSPFSLFNLSLFLNPLLLIFGQLWCFFIVRHCHHASQKLLSNTPAPPPSRSALFRQNRPRKKKKKIVLRPPSRDPFRLGSININGLGRQSAWALETLLRKRNLDVLCVSETHYRSDIPQAKVEFGQYDVFRSERSSGQKGGGGLSIYYKKSLQVHNYTPVVPTECSHLSNERQWLLLQLGSQKVAILHCYLACVSSKSDDFKDWNMMMYQMMSSEAQQLKARNFAIVCLGNFV